jgi:hypothetical protein
MTNEEGNGVAKGRGPCRLPIFNKTQERKSGWLLLSAPSSQSYEKQLKTKKRPFFFPLSVFLSYLDKTKRK